MDVIFTFLAAQPVIVVFLLLGIGSALGRIRVGGVSLGAVAVLFSAMGLVAWSVAVGQPIAIPSYIGDVGLVVFAFCTGVIAGPGFFNAMKTAYPLMIVVTVMMALAAFAAIVLGKLVNLIARHDRGRLRRRGDEHAGPRGDGRKRRGDRRLRQHLRFRRHRGHGRGGARAAQQRQGQGHPEPDRRQARPGRHDVDPQDDRHRQGARQQGDVLASQRRRRGPGRGDRAGHDPLRRRCRERRRPERHRRPGRRRTRSHLRDRHRERPEPARLPPDHPLGAQARRPDDREPRAFGRASARTSCGCGAATSSSSAAPRSCCSSATACAWWARPTRCPR